MPKRPIPVPPGHVCTPDARVRDQRQPRIIELVADDAELQAVYAWLTEPTRGVTERLKTAVDDAVRYVLDSTRTRRFYLLDGAVDGDERATVGTKLQYYIVEELELVKQPPLDTVVVGVAVEIKTTTRDAHNVMVPPEGQCEVTLMIHVDIANHEFSARLMRAHRGWLGGPPYTKQRDQKRSPIREAFELYSLVVVPPTSLTPEPLRLLTPAQAAEVLARDLGVRERATALFHYLPEIVIPRRTLETVGAGRADFMKRMREAKPYVWHRHGLHMLVWRLKEDREVARKMGFDLSGGAWVAVRPGTFAQHGVPEPAVPSMPPKLWPGTGSS